VKRAIFQTQDPNLSQTALRALQMTPGKQTMGLVKRLLERAAGDPSLQSSLTETRERIQSSRRGNPCLNH
jgi:hypothetical protein